MSQVTYHGPSETIQVGSAVHKRGDTFTVEDDVLRILRGSGHRFTGDKGSTPSGKVANPDLDAASAAALGVDSSLVKAAEEVREQGLENAPNAPADTTETGKTTKKS